MKAAIYSPYLDALGGGERYIMTIAEYLLMQGWQVDILWKDLAIKDKLADRFHLNLTNASVVPDDIISQGIRQKYTYFRKYDVFLYLSDGSFPLGSAKKNIMHMQIPLALQNGKSLFNKLKLKTWQSVICNSELTKSFIDKSFGITSTVVYPPIDLSAFHQGIKENVIITVGRFHGLKHGKKQEFLIEAFKKLHVTCSDWKFILVGSIENQSYFDDLKKQSEGYPIELYGDLPFTQLIQLYENAAVYWHAQGFGETEARYQEHFGMTTVEAMASGCVPVVIGNGGQKEIISHGTDGFLWQTEVELLDFTKQLIEDTSMRSKLEQAAIEKSKQFSKEMFYQRIDDILKAEGH